LVPGKSRPQLTTTADKTDTSPDALSADVLSCGTLNP
jgi:hypothetical protein